VTVTEGPAEPRQTAGAGEEAARARPPRPRFCGFTPRRCVGNLLIVGGFVGLLLYLHFRVIRVAYVPSGSMQPTIRPADRVLIALGAYHHSPPEAGDIIAFWSPERGEYETKRVIGVAGDQIAIVGGFVFRNGHVLPEPYIAEPMFVERPIRREVPEGQLFVMGDNRNGSEDSRDYGSIRRSEVMGRVFFRILPIRRFGPVR
jgi:signal peptidase I